MSKIIFDRVRKQFGPKVAVNDVSFEIPAGKVFGLLGPNGAGKTTLIRMLMDIIKPDTGTILYDGHSLTEGDKDRLTYLPEERGLYRKEKVRDVLEYFAQLKGLSAQLARRRTLEFLAKLEMPDAAMKKVEELSKGNQQKIQLAAALISDPEVIILDEPFAGLDPLNVQLAKSVMADEREKGKTILLSTHQMNQVEELCDGLLMINLGRQVLYGPLDSIVERYSEKALLLECSPIPSDVPEAERVVAENRHWKVYPKPGVTPTEVLRSLIQRGVQIEKFQKAATPLEQIFIKVARESGGEATL